MKNDLLGYRKEIRRGVNKSQLIFSLSLLVQFFFSWCLMETLVEIASCLVIQGVICDYLFLLNQIS